MLIAPKQFLGNIITEFMMKLILLDTLLSSIDAKDIRYHVIKNNIIF